MSRFPPILLNCLWHSTSSERFESIIQDGAILPEPNIPNESRWGTSKGPSHYPFVRSLGGVSLFDFTDFDPAKCNSSWFTFVPVNVGCGRNIWIEIDRELVGKSLIEPDDLVEKWEASNELRRNIMPRIEAAHIGPLPLSTFVRVLAYESGVWREIVDWKDAVDCPAS